MKFDINIEYIEPIFKRDKHCLDSFREGKVCLDILNDMPDLSKEYFVEINFVKNLGTNLEQYSRKYCSWYVNENVSYSVQQMVKDRFQTDTKIVSINFYIHTPTSFFSAVCNSSNLENKLNYLKKIADYKILYKN